MMEIFEDFTVDKADRKEYVMIPKREHNPQLSVLGNMVLDLVDFKDRVRPLSQDISMFEQANRYQKRSPSEYSRAQFDSMLNELRGASNVIESEGYSSGELPPSAQEEEPVVQQAEAEAEVEAPVVEEEEQAASDEQVDPEILESSDQEVEAENNERKE